MLALARTESQGQVSRRGFTRDPLQPARISHFIVDKPMPATPKDIKELEQILRWAEQKNSHATSDILRDALRRALEYISEPDRRINRALFILGALRQSVRKNGDGWWLVLDRDLHDWALEEIEKVLNASELERYNEEANPTQISASGKRGRH